MNKDEIRILSPLTILAVLLLDASVIGVSVFAIKKLIEGISLLSIAFAFMVILAIIIACLVSKEVISNKIVFNDEGLELVGLDNDNKYLYKDIVKVEYQKDDKASFKKNFNDRHAILVLHLTDNIATIDLGLITKKSLLKIVNKIESNISK